MPISRYQVGNTETQSRGSTVLTNSKA